jgi:hypothetical protein
VVIFLNRRVAEMQRVFSNCHSEQRGESFFRSFVSLRMTMQKKVFKSTHA